MLEILKENIYGLKEAIISSGYPMTSGEEPQYNEQRAKKLAQTPIGSGHSNYLKGIIVQFDIKYANYWTPQFQRYSHIEIVSSTSKMHRLIKMNVKECCNEFVDDVVIENLNNWIERYNNYQDNDSMTKHELFMRIISNCPMGLEQVMSVSTNYLQLKTIYNQRRHHKLDDWQIFCDWIETLPMAKELII